MIEVELVVVADAAAAVSEGARRIAAILASTIVARGRADWAVTGGSMAAGIYRALIDRAIRDSVPWANVHAWWGDDRYVPRGHPLSNVKPFDDILLGLDAAPAGVTGGPAGVAIPHAQLHPFRTTEAIGHARGAAWCAAALADELREAGPAAEQGWPAFDLLTLGMGGDGHILSVFPGSLALDSPELALAIPAPTHIGPHVERLTQNPGIVMAARRIVVVVVGTEKAVTVADVLGPIRDPRRWPAQLALRAGATWILDAAAAAHLRR
jgi:6-phosphogluconolactonase